MTAFSRLQRNSHGESCTNDTFGTFGTVQIPTRGLSVQDAVPVTSYSDDACSDDVRIGKEACEMTQQTSAEGTSLDSDLETFRDDLQKASELVVRLYGGLDRARVTPAKSRMEIALQSVTARNARVT